MADQLDQDDYRDNVGNIQRSLNVRRKIVNAYVDMNGDGIIEGKTEFIQVLVIRALRRMCSDNPDYHKVAKESMNLAHFFEIIKNTLHSFIRLELQIYRQIWEYENVNELAPYFPNI
jgi:hypothetical protein